MKFKVIVIFYAFLRKSLVINNNPSANVKVLLTRNLELLWHFNARNNVLEARIKNILQLINVFF